MSEPTKESLIRAACLRSKVAHAMTQKGWGEESANQVLALEFDAIRAEERKKAEKLVEALRWLAKWQHDGRDPGHCNRKVEDCPHHACRRTIAALAAWEGAQHG